MFWFSFCDCVFTSELLSLILFWCVCVYYVCVCVCVCTMCVCVCVLCVCVCVRERERKRERECFMLLYFLHQPNPPNKYCTYNCILFPHVYELQGRWQYLESSLFSCFKENYTVLSITCISCLLPVLSSGTIETCVSM